MAIDHLGNRPANSMVKRLRAGFQSWIGSEPFFLTLAQGFGWFSLFIMLVGVYVAVLGYLEQR